MTRRTGELVQWNNKAGFGFVRDSTGNDFYVHISKIAEGTRPRLGDQLIFEIAAGRKGRPSAVNVLVTPSAPPPPPTLRETIMRRPATVSSRKLGLRVAAATMMTLLLIWAIAGGRAPLWLGLVYAGMGLASALLYRFDKIYALANRWRVSEANLHIVDLSFGIIGGLSAQELYRHKTVKPRFVATTWTIALFHLLLLALLSLGWLKAIVPLAG